MSNKFINFFLGLAIMSYGMILPFISFYVARDKFFYNMCLTINIIVLISAPLYYLCNYLIERKKLKTIENELIIQKIEITYFREIIKNYSPAILSLIHDCRLFYNEDLIISILYLENKGYIKIENNKIYLTGKDTSNLNDNLKYIIENYDVFLNKKRYIKEYGEKIKTKSYIFKKNWKKVVGDEATKKELVIQRKESSMIARYLLSILLFMEGMFFYAVPESLEMLLFAFFLSLLTFVLKKISFTWNQYPKTAKGYEIYAKLKGLENFIKDFSRLDEKQVEEIKLWDDYIIYALMFNNNSKLNKDSKRLYKQLIKEAN